MSRLLVVLLATVSLVAVAAAPALASEEHPTQRELESELICPACHATLDESDSEIARQMKDYIRQRIAEGATKSQIEGELVAQLGEGVLGVPRKHGFDLLAWVIPIGGVMLGAALLAAGAWQWSRTRSHGGGPGPLAPALDAPLDPVLDRRVDEELRRYDG
jgi:cytochrome c-type biogenesis protein CcmH